MTLTLSEGCEPEEKGKPWPKLDEGGEHWVREWGEHRERRTNVREGGAGGTLGRGERSLGERDQRE